MISVLGSIIILIYLIALLMAVRLNKLDKFRWDVFNAAIGISIFVNVGNCFRNYSFTEICTLLVIITAIISIPKNKLRYINIRVFYASVVLLVVILISFAYVSLRSSSMPYVLPMDVNMDKAYYGVQRARRAEITRYNYIALFDLIIFMLAVILNRDYLSDNQRINELLDNIKKIFHIFFVFASIEFIVNNFISPTVIRNFTLTLVGTMDKSKTFYPENRMGYYGVTGLFSEQSYISVLLIYYSIIWKTRIRDTKELIYYSLSTIVLLMSGCSTGIMLIPLALFIFIKECIRKNSNTKLKIIETFFTIFIVSVSLYLVLFNSKYFTESIDQTLVKFNAFVKGGNYYSDNISASGATRNYANNIALNAFFKSPIFGVGIGGTRGYGVIVGLLATFGIAGILAFYNFLNSVFRLTLKKNVILFIILLIYLSSVLSVWYSYYIAFIPIYVLFSKDLEIQGK